VYVATTVNQVMAQGGGGGGGGGSGGISLSIIPGQPQTENLTCNWYFR